MNDVIYVIIMNVFCLDTLNMGANFSSFWAKWFGTTEMRILMVGLDAAGKTTILYKLKLGEVVTTIPTIGKLYFSSYPLLSETYLITSHLY